MHALIIEDESLIAMAIEEVLRGCGFSSFDFAVSAEEATTLAYGQRITATGIAGPHAAVDPAGRLVALVEDAGATARVTVGFPPAS